LLKGGDLVDQDGQNGAGRCRTTAQARSVIDSIRLSFGGRGNVATPRKEDFSSHTAIARSMLRLLRSVESRHLLSTKLS
jgi:hypothetical protein